MAGTDICSRKIAEVEAWRLCKKDQSGAPLQPRAFLRADLPLELVDIVGKVSWSSLEKIKLDDTNLNANLNLGLAMHWAGHPEGAASQYSLVLDLAPPHLWHCQKALAGLEDIEHANEQMRNVSPNA